MSKPTKPDSAGRALSRVLDMLDVKLVGNGCFEGSSPQTPWRRLYGGQVIGQALMAACKHVGQIAPDRLPHALHLIFLRPGDPRQTVLYQIEVLRDGRAFTAADVFATQGDKAIARATVSFHADADAVVEHDDLGPMPMPPQPDGSEPDFLDFAPLPIQRYWRGANGDAPSPVTIIPIDATRYQLGRLQPPHQAFWMRSSAPLPDNRPELAAALLAYLSDMTLLDTALAPTGQTIFSDAYAAASLDHSFWMHRATITDDWFFYRQDSPIATKGRGFARGSFYNRTGKLIASSAQEGVIRAAPRAD